MTKRARQWMERLAHATKRRLVVEADRQAQARVRSFLRHQHAPAFRQRPAFTRTS